MSRDRQEAPFGSYSREQGREESRQRNERDWERDPRQRSRGGYERGRNDYDRQDDRRYADRNRDERDYSARYLGYEARYEPRQDYQRFPASYGPYDADARRVRGFDEDQDYGDYGRERWSQSDYGARSGYSGSGRNLDTGWSSQSHGYGARDDQSRGRWGERDDRERSHEGLGEQLRHAGERMVRKVKRAFRGPKGYKRSDERIREDVNDRLSEQDHFDPSEIEVAVANSEVTLTGSVSSRQEKFLAEEIADDVNGVAEVHNQLRVRRDDAPRVSGTEPTLPGATSNWSQRNGGNA